MKSYYSLPLQAYNRSWRRFLATLMVLGILLVPSTPAWADEPMTPAATEQVSWLEPRGLSIIDLVGLVPEDHLKDTILTWHSGGGLLQYLSGTRSGDTVTVNVKVAPRYYTDGRNSVSIFSCLGKPSLADEWTVAVAPASMRVYDGGTEVTSQVETNMSYVPAGQNPPTTSASGWWRYEFAWGTATTFNTDGSIQVPANMGCQYKIPGKRTTLTAQFVVQTTNYITVEDLGSEAFIFHSYIGVGDAGHFGRLNSQMAGRFGNRHDKFQLSPPSGTDYLLVKYPPTPVDPYMGRGGDETNISINIDQPSSGSYRLVGSGNTLSVDHVNSMAIPLAGQWQDADQSGGTYLKFFSNAGRIAVPEYFVPDGVPYDACMRNGGCSNDLLDYIYHKEMSMTVYYYRIGRIAEGLTRLPLKQVGPSWKPGSVAASAEADVLAATVNKTEQAESIYLPYVSVAPAPPKILDDGDRSGCPCGWFDGYGRMFDYVPAP